MNRPKLLIIGSGFHKNILGNCNSSLSCWKTLLKAVAKRRKIDTSDVPFDQPALAWESLVINGAGQKKGSKDASQTEKELRKTVVDIISSEMEAYNDRYQQCSFSISLKGFKGHIVNLNFDHMLDKLLGVQPIPKSKPSDTTSQSPKKRCKGLVSEMEISKRLWRACYGVASARDCPGGGIATIGPTRLWVSANSLF
jgi:hypothetical protein